MELVAIVAGYAFIFVTCALLVFLFAYGAYRFTSMAVDKVWDRALSTARQQVASEIKGAAVWLHGRESKGALEYIASQMHSGYRIDGDNLRRRLENAQKTTADEP